MCEDTKLKAIHNGIFVWFAVTVLSSMCEDTKLKAIHNTADPRFFVQFVVFNVRRY